MGKTDTHRKQSQGVLAIRSNIPGDRIIIPDSLGIATSNTPHIGLLNEDMTIILYKDIRYDDEKKKEFTHCEWASNDLPTFPTPAEVE